MEETSVNTLPLNSFKCLGMLPAVDDALYAIGGKWKLKVLIALSSGPHRFNQLQRMVTGISARVLSNELKELELNRLIKKNILAPSIPAIVEYELTEYADTLSPMVQAIVEWGVMHRKKVMSTPQQ
ncbi:MAG TPA: helix-turn-helix domain-containing protein [Chitinophaga sp.]|uniref:winged helix-turn-helix transcriptional regulator n=1 Tax=Chitinophaga sp. TaxID=1869181 RepID=UPI002C73FF6D|nr:helix-turn-helix domain-containing protein [Chitinophaga sp.]HVI45741.1 helix-turn-helix domain-containing protein [Chitinophaga sp.]